MDDVDVLLFQKLPEVAVPFHPSDAHPFLQVLSVHVTNGDEPRTGGPEVPVPHPPYPDDRFGQLVAWRRIARSPQDPAGNDRECPERKRRLDKRAPAECHLPSMPSVEHFPHRDACF